MERSRAILRIYSCCGDNHIVRRDDLFNLAVPIAGILAVGSYKFLDREMLVRAMPIHISIGVEIFSYLVCSLCENVRPKLLYVHYLSSLIKCFTVSVGFFSSVLKNSGYILMSSSSETHFRCSLLLSSVKLSLIGTKSLGIFI